MKDIHGISCGKLIRGSNNTPRPRDRSAFRAHVPTFDRPRCRHPVATGRRNSNSQRRFHATIIPQTSPAECTSFSSLADSMIASGTIMEIHLTRKFRSFAFDNWIRLVEIVAMHPDPQAHALSRRSRISDAPCVLPIVDVSLLNQDADASSRERFRKFVAGAHRHVRNGKFKFRRMRIFATRRSVRRTNDMSRNRTRIIMRLARRFPFTPPTIEPQGHPRPVALSRRGSLS